MTTDIEQRLLPLFLKYLVLSVINYGLGILTLSASESEKPENKQNEGMRIVLVCTWETPIITMRYILGLTSVKFRFTLIQARVYIRITNDDMHSLFSNLNYANGIRLKCGTSRKLQTGDTNKWLVMSVQHIRGRLETFSEGDWKRYPLYFQSYGRFIFSESLECNFI